MTDPLSMKASTNLSVVLR
jgi:hypothetical protein